MNITKRMLQFGAAAVAVAIGCNALAAGLTIPAKESFEGYAEGYSATNLTQWTGGADDASIITNLTYTFAPVTEGITYPLVNTNHTKVLKLNTEGGILAANLDTDDTSFAVNPIYVDTMVNMVISEDDPSFAGATDVKVAVFANATSNLVIRHGIYASPPGGGHYATNSVTDVKVNPTNWYRLTISMRQEDIEGSNYSLFKVALDGVTVSNANARIGSEWFDVAIPVGAGNYNLLASTSFQGTGLVDDLVVTADDPFVPTGVTYVYVIAEYVNGAGPTFITVPTPAAGWNKAYSPADTWSKIGLDTGTASFFTVTNTTVYAPADEVALRGTNVLKVLTNVAKTATELGGQFSGLTQSQLDWVKTFGNPSTTPFDTDDNTPAFEQAMALNPYTNETVTAEITAYTVGSPNSTITVNVQVGNVDYNASGLTVKIVIDSKENLADAWTLGVAEVNVTGFDVNGEASISFATPSANFFRARIVEQ